MLRQRVLTAVVLVAVLLGVMLGLPPIATIWLVTVLVLIGAWEWAAFIGNGSAPARATFTVTVAAFLIGSLYLYSSSAEFVRGAMTLAMVWWVAALLWICVAPTRVNPVSAAVAGILSLVPCWLALVYITFTTNSTHWVLFTLALVWAADTGAFFAGRWLGRVPLAPRVSPKKTWEGVFGGMLVSGFVAWLAATFVFSVDVWQFVAICIAVAAVSIVGDLTESMLKRAVGLKDSGSVFPGHGGMLDRIDSVTAAAPALVFALLSLQVIP
ncbi:MAG TPA: phosphatidate cytidylyltransferase [Steroidobacteraceae bacterium]|nr:phosphatidate cytidylyltransferase [Steroidobacteraceae bacterium]